MAAAARTAIRSAAVQNVASRISTGAKPSASRSRFLNQKPLSHRIFRSPVEMSSCVDSMLPYHTATASSLLTSMLTATRTYGWTLEGTTSATVLTRVIATEGCKSVTAGMNVMGLRHGVTMSVDVVVTNLRSRARMMSTSSTSGKEITHNLPDLPFVDAFLMKAKKNKELLNNRKIWSRRSSILPEFVGSIVRIYNGKSFVRCKITEGKVDHKFGEFALTRKRRPRIIAAGKKKDKRGK